MTPGPAAWERGIYSAGVFVGEHGSEFAEAVL